MTTRARAGSSGAELAGTGRFLEEGLEVVGGEATRGLLEALQPPGLEVEVDVAGGGLDRAPQRPPAPRRQRLQPDPRQFRAQRPAVVGRHQGGDLVVIEVALGAGVAELEAGVVVA